MNDFVLKFQTFDGCFDILKNRGTEDILSIVSGITGITSDILCGLEVEALGKTGIKVSYPEILRELKRYAVILRRIYQKFGNNNSKITLFSIIRYWLLPDKDFLKAALSSNEDDAYRQLYADQPVFTISKPGEVKDHIEEIRRMKPGEYLDFDFDNLFFDLVSVFELISVLRKDLFFTQEYIDVQRVIISAFSPVPKIES